MLLRVLEKIDHTLDIAGCEYGRAHARPIHCPFELAANMGLTGGLTLSLNRHIVVGAVGPV